MKLKDNTYGLHWFRRDLRFIGNQSLQENLQIHNGRVLGIFFFDSKFLNRLDFSHNRFGFFLKTLKALRKELNSLGGDLLVLDFEPLIGFPKLFDKLKQLKRPLPSLCSFNRDYEPFALNRDRAVTKMLHDKFKVSSLTTPDHLLIEPHEISRPDGGTYQIFTPFSKRWYEVFESKEIQLRLKNVIKTQVSKLKKPFKINWNDLFGINPPFKDQLDIFIKVNLKNITVKLPTAGSLVAAQKLMEFRKIVTNYSKRRDYPSENHTSQLSIYLKNGSLSTAQIFSVIGENNIFGFKNLAAPFLRQLVWREFYYHILYHHPRVEEEAFKEKYKGIHWQNRKDWFEAWKNGMTGFPLVDAGMRQLLLTGWMHNRVRMVVASFLTKDLLIDWRWGEKWFMQNLLDGDLAANNGGWQWAASTGCDPQPYFRIFNPELQSKRFDPNGDYIRKYVPELKHLSSKDIHAPPERLRPHSYPRPIVIHSKQKQKALELYR